jgi:hypothetical protein
MLIAIKLLIHDASTQPVANEPPAKAGSADRSKALLCNSIVERKISGANESADSIAECLRDLILFFVSPSSSSITSLCCDSLSLFQGCRTGAHRTFIASLWHKLQMCPTALRCILTHSISIRTAQSIHGQGITRPFNPNRRPPDPAQAPPSNPPRLARNPTIPSLDTQPME